MIWLQNKYLKVKPTGGIFVSVLGFVLIVDDLG
ncbi:hypothetical protein SHLO109777_00475 [Shewanella loihica]